ncbi:MAG: phage tail-like protein [Myxococcota bacterium]|jgi:phage tail-like protein
MTSSLFSSASGAIAANSGVLGGVGTQLAKSGLGMLMSGAFAGRRDPDLAFSYMVEIDGLSLGMFTEASGIKWSMDIQPIKEGGNNHHQQHLLGRAKFDPLVLKRGFVGGDGMLFDMMHQTFDPNLPIVRKLVNVVILSRGGSGGGLLGLDEIGRLAFYRCFVKEWTGPTFNTKTNDVAVEQITFCYDYLEFHPGGPLQQLLGAAGNAAMSTAAGAALGGKVSSLIPSI